MIYAMTIMCYIFFVCNLHYSYSSVFVKPVEDFHYAFPVRESRAPVGSSASSNFGSPTMERAIAHAAVLPGQL